jgi:hypothetical protein
MKQKWIEYCAERGCAHPRPERRGLICLGWKPAVWGVHELLCRHPNQRKKKSGLLKEMHESHGNGSSIKTCRNSCGEIYDRSSRMRLIRSTMDGTRRAHLKEQTRQHIEEELQ